MSALLKVLRLVSLTVVRLVFRMVIIHFMTSFSRVFVGSLGKRKLNQNIHKLTLISYIISY